MNREKLCKIALILLPVLAVGLATTQDSVTVFDRQANVTLYGSYFSLLPVGEKQMLAPLAGILSVVVLILAIVYLVRKKEGMITAIKWCSFAAAICATLPIVLQGELLVIPHVGVPIFMGLEWVVAYLLTPKVEAPKTL